MFSSFYFQTAIDMLLQQSNATHKTSKELVEEANIHKKSAVPTGDESSTFFKEANAEPGVLLSGCTIPTGGCHDWGKTIQAKFPKMESITAKVDNFNGINIAGMTIRDPKQWKYMVVTGCEGVNEIAKFVKQLQQTYQCDNVKTVFIIVPPNNSFYVNESGLKKLLQDEVNNPNIKLEFLIGGLDLDSSSNIGIPKPFLTSSSSYILPKNCYGLMYANAQQTFNNITYLKNYFEQIAKIPCDQGKTVIVINTNVANDHQTLLKDYASEYGITLQFVDKLPQPDFISAISQVSKKGGYVATDGVQSAIQAFSLGGRVLIASKQNNQYFYAECVSKLTDDLRETADAIFGLNPNYKLLDDASKVAQVFKELQRIIQNAIAKFDKSNAMSKEPVNTSFNMLPLKENRQTIMTDYFPKVESQSDPWLSKFLVESSSPVVSKGPGLFGQYAPSVPSFAPATNANMELDTPRAAYR